MKKFLTLIFSFLTLLLYCQQSGELKGIIENDKSEPLPSASVSVLGKNARGTTSDLDGNFTLSNLEKGDVIRFSYVGMITQDITYMGQTEIKVKLVSQSTQLDEVVVIGYGTQTKKDLTGAYSGLAGAELASQPALTPVQSLQGKIAGVQIVNSGAPGQSAQVRIRGTGTLLAGADPLYVVDGILTNSIMNINSSDILSMEVLKDASSAAIYGVRGANGVIIITTKKGSEGKPKVSYSGYMGFNTKQNKIKMADSDLYAAYNNEALERAGQNPYFPADYKAPYNTDWFDQVTRDGIVQNHNVSLSGGTKAINYFASSSYYQNAGILKGNDYDRLTFRLTSDVNISKYFKFGANIALSAFNTYNVTYSVFSNAYRQAPIIAPKNSDGTWGYFDQINVANPVAQIEYTNDKTEGYRTQAAAYLDVMPFKGFKYHSQISIDLHQLKIRNYQPVYEVSPSQIRKTSELALTSDKTFNWIWDNIFSYDYTKEKNNVQATLGMTAEEQSGHNLFGKRQGVPNQKEYWTLNLGDITTAENSSSLNKSRRASYLARVFYGYDNRYLATLTGRVDGSSKFPTDNRWAFFPSVGLGWRISGEKFMQDVKGVSNLKLRGSWGQLGNDGIPADAFVYTVTPGLNYVLGDEQLAIPGATVTDIKDPNLKWEKTDEWDIGIDYGFFTERLSGSIDYYHKKTKDALIYSPIDAVFGDPDGAYLTNKADILNQGVEFTIGWQNTITEKMNYAIGFNFTYNDNKITNIEGGLPIVSGYIGNGQVATRTQTGKPVGAFWMYQADGIFQTQEQLDSWLAEGHPVLEGTKVGDLKLIDRNKDGVLDDEDKFSPGAYAPKFMMGLNFQFNFYGFDLQTELYSVIGNKIYNANKAARMSGDNIQADLKDRWTPSNTNTNIPRASNVVPVSSTFYLEDGSFLKMNTITLGYSIPEKAIEKIRMDKIRIYFTAQNPFVITKYSGFSTELPAGTLNSGVDQNAFPQTANFLFGLNLNF